MIIGYNIPDPDKLRLRKAERRNTERLLLPNGDVLVRETKWFGQEGDEYYQIKYRLEGRQHGKGGIFYYITKAYKNDPDNFEVVSEPFKSLNQAFIAFDKVLDDIHSDTSMSRKRKTTKPKTTRKPVKKCKCK
jgi:hypothetical protein